MTITYLVHIEEKKKHIYTYLKNKDYFILFYFVFLVSEEHHEILFISLLMFGHIKKYFLLQ